MRRGPRAARSARVSAARAQRAAAITRAHVRAPHAPRAMAETTTVACSAQARAQSRRGADENRSRRKNRRATRASRTSRGVCCHTRTHARTRTRRTEQCWTHRSSPRACRLRQSNGGDAASAAAAPQLKDPALVAALGLFRCGLAGLASCLAVLNSFRPAAQSSHNSSVIPAAQGSATRERRVCRCQTASETGKGAAASAPKHD